MWRFYVAATAIVAAFVFLVTQTKRPAPDLRVSARASGTPSPARVEASSRPAGDQNVEGEAPWALSALPDCARQRAEARGAPLLVRAKIPTDAIELHGSLVAGPCTIHIARDGIEVDRGDDHLRIPAPARLLRSGDRYYLYRENRKGAELRVYSLQK